MFPKSHLFVASNQGQLKFDLKFVCIFSRDRFRIFTSALIIIGKLFFVKGRTVERGVNNHDDDDDQRWRNYLFCVKYGK